MLFPKNYLKNLVKLAQRDSLLDPLVAVFHLTDKCNLDCVYCEDYGARLNHLAGRSLSLGAATKVLNVIRTGVENIILTGGETFLYPYIDELIRIAKNELEFNHLTVLSNGTLLPQHEDALQYIDRLVISLDSVNSEHWTSILRSPIKMAESIIDNIIHYSNLQNEFGFQLVVNTVLTAGTLDRVNDILEFCEKHGILVSFSPQSVNNWPSYDLFTSNYYQDVIREIMENRERDKFVLGSAKYLQVMKELKSYDCYPTLAPRIMPNGELIYPCRPIEKQGNEFGGRPVNLLDVETWEEAIRIAEKEYGPPPTMCTSCFQQCYVEPSLMQVYPLSYLAEKVFYKQNRSGAVEIHAPG